LGYLSAKGYRWCDDGRRHRDEDGQIHAQLLYDPGNDQTISEKAQRVQPGLRRV